MKPLHQFDDLTVHPYADCYPMISGEQWRTFCESILATNGPEQPVILWDDRERETTWLIDGRNRFKACEDLGLPLTEYRYKDFNNDDEVRTYINLINDQRRHMTKQQRTIVALEMMKVQQDLGRERQREGAKALGSLKKEDYGKNLLANWPKGSSHDSRKIVASELEVPESEIKRAKIIQDKGAKETIEAYKQGLASTNALQLISDLPKEEQVEIVNQGKKAIKEKASEIRAIKKQEKVNALPPEKRPTKDLGYQIVKGYNHGGMTISCSLMTDEGPALMKIKVDQQACDEIIQLLRTHDWFNG